MTEAEAEARAALAASDAVGGIERWVAKQSWEAVPGGWTVPGEFHGLRFRVALVPDGVRLTASEGKVRPAVWTVPGRPAPPSA